MKRAAFSLFVLVLTTSISARAAAECPGGPAAKAVVESVARTTLPSQRLLRAQSSTVEGSENLTDLDLKTAWSVPARAENAIATFSLPAPLTLTKVSLAAPEGGFLPLSFSLLTQSNEYRITLDKASRAATITLETPTRTECLALALKEPAPLKRTVAEIFVSTRFEGRSRADLIAALSTSEAEDAAAILKATNHETVPLLASSFESMNEQAKGLALDVAASVAECDVSSPLFVRAATDGNKEIAKKGEARVIRCGKKSAEALKSALASKNEELRSFSATMLALVAPNTSAEDLSKALVVGGSPATRRALRSALAKSIRDVDSDRIGPLLFPAGADDRAALDLLRAGVHRLGDAGSEAKRTVARLSESASADERYLLCEPARALASPSSIQLLAGLANDKDPHVRAHAAQLASATPFLTPILAKAAKDPEPRVREAAFNSLAKIGWTEGEVVFTKAMLDDPWTFVRTAAATSLARLPAGASTDGAIVSGLDSNSKAVKRALIEGIEAAADPARAALLEARLDERKDDAEIQTRIARALGTMCFKSSTESLVRAANRTDGGANEAALETKIAAVSALGRIHPPNLNERIGGLASSPEPALKEAFERALKEKEACAR